VQDVLIACVDGLTGSPQVIQTAFPKTEIQLCSVHQIPNSLKYVASKNQKELMKNLRKVYQAPSKDNAESYLLEFEEKGGEKYPMVIKSWRSNGEHWSHYFQ
jgi:transposase-like protein